MSLYCAVLCDFVRCMCCFLVECMFFCKHCHRAKAQLHLNKYIYIFINRLIMCKDIMAVHTENKMEPIWQSEKAKFPKFVP
jgi:hypothetical protein